MANQTNSITSFRSNTQTPAAGNQGSNAEAVRALLPNTVAAKSLAENLFSNSGYNCSQLDEVALIPNQQIQFKLLNTGLSEKVAMFITGTINLKNTAATAQTVNIAPEFPFNIVSNWNALFNGQTTIFSASGYETMALNNKRWKGTLIDSFSAANGRTQANVRVCKKYANIQAGTNITLTAGNGLCGYSSLSLAANSTGTITFELVLILPFTMRDDIPIGLLAMQNNSITCNINIYTNSLLGTSPSTPLYVPTAIPANLTVDSSTITGKPVQYYWETPSNSQLYQYFIGNSYMFISAPNQSCQGTGQRALHYDIGNNFVLTGLLFTLRDNTGALIDVTNRLDNFELNYNNTVSVMRQPMAIRDYLQQRYYLNPPVGLGQLLWDATTHEFQANGLSDSDFLDLYMANNPQCYLDVAASVPTPINYSVAAEMLIPSQVKTA